MNDSGFKANAQPLVSVIIVTYNSTAVIDACLSSLDPMRNSDIEVIVVDNASGDSTSSHVKQHYPSVKLLENDSNEGFAVAVNQGAGLATGPYIALLNPDAVLSSESLRQIVSLHQHHGRPCITAPLIVHPSDRLRIISAGRFPSAWRMFCHYFGLSRMSRSRTFQGHYLVPGSLSAIEEVDWVTGAALLVSRDDWRRLHGLTERWFMYAEDIEFCYRAKSSGMDVLLLTEVTASHLVGESTGEPKSMKADWIVNLYDFYRTSMVNGPISGLLWKLVVGLGLLSRSALYWIASVRSKEVRARDGWKHESRRFLFFAGELMKA